MVQKRIRQNCLTEFSVSGQEKIEATELLFFLKQDLLREKRLLNHASLGNKDNKEILQTSAFSWIERLTVPQLDFLSFMGFDSYKTAKSVWGFGELVDSCGIKINFHKYATITRTSLIAHDKHSSSLITVANKHQSHLGLYVGFMSKCNEQKTTDSILNYHR